MRKIKIWKIWKKSKLTYPRYTFNKYDGLKPREKSILTRAQYVIL